MLGVAASAVLAAKALRQLWLFAELGLLNPPVQKFKGAWALVTGGSEGVGKAVAAELARNGINVLLVSRSQAKLDAAAADIKRQHSDVQVRTFAADLTQRQQLDALLQHITHTSTHISLLVANAGGAVPRMTNYWQFSDDEEERMQALNGAACYVLVKALLPDMVQRGKGAVVAISSSMHRLGAFVAPYAAEKAKVNALCNALHHELHGSGVTAQAMVLGAVVTPGLLSMWAPQKPAAAAASAAASAAEANSAAAAASPSSSTAVAAAPAAALKPSITMPSAETAAAAIVRSIGRGGPLVMPYWGHSCSEALLLDVWWPPELGRFVAGWVARAMKSNLDARVAAAQSG